MKNYISKAQMDQFIRARNFSGLFIELGWDCDNLSQKNFLVSLGDKKFGIEAIAEKRGFTVFICDVEESYLKSASDRQYIAKKVALRYYEHLLILYGKKQQYWIASIRPQNRPIRIFEIGLQGEQYTQKLQEKLDGLIFNLTEEGTIGLTDVVERVRSSFMSNAEKVTKKFYSQFKNELSEFTKFIKGIQEQVTKNWYASLMINRLMFIYFIQKKKFLNNDPKYLENRLKYIEKKYGKNKFHNQFYRHFLRRLFSEGLGTPESDRSADLKELLGQIPYLNGGLFDLHEIEKENTTIQIPDKAFKRLFTFFNEYNWHLDTRATASGKDINPDVIGYIFEKYINYQAANINHQDANIDHRSSKGAYYTQEDITGYIARNTIIPFLLHRAREKCKNAFDPENGIWRFLRENPDNYIYDAIKAGCDIPDAEIPENIRHGIDTEAPNLLERRKDWNTKAEERFALPTETWRETMVRRKRYSELKQKIKNGEIHEIDDLITYNLDIECFVSNALRNYEGTDFIIAFYEAIAGRKSLRSNMPEKRGITVLDPACGSGAFLFAALNILEPLYERCVESMNDFIERNDKLKKHSTQKGMKNYPQFDAILKDIKKHPNKKYWIYKTIILNNLYGVDIMKEATEIAKLRLFLKLAAAVECDPKKDNLGLDPLPDIDFNIRSGNSLIGYENMEAFESYSSTDITGQGLMDHSGGLLDEIREQASLVQKAHDAFKKAQDIGSKEYQSAKAALSERLEELNNRMNYHFSEDYGIEKGNETNYEKWLSLYQPFHWLAEFYGIIEKNQKKNKGKDEDDHGFDVIIGNPPYVEYRSRSVDYRIKNYQTLSCGNLYAYFLERSINISCNIGRVGMIIPIALVSTPRAEAARSYVNRKGSSIHISNYADRPGTLFNGVHQKTSIILIQKSGKKASYTTNFMHWFSRHERANLFDQICYVDSQQDRNGTYLKFRESIESKLSKKIACGKDSILSLMSPKKSKSKPLYLNMRLMLWVKCFLHAKKSREFKTYFPLSTMSNKEIMAILNSNTFFWFWETISDCWHLTNRELQNFFITQEKFSIQEKENLSSLSEELVKDLEKNKSFVGTVQTEYEYYHKKSKHIIDEIDTILSRHYNFTEEELDYIINYNIKYRMGLDS